MLTPSSRPWWHALSAAEAAQAEYARGAATAPSGAISLDLVEGIIRSVKEASWAARPKAMNNRGILKYRNDSTDNHFIELAKRDMEHLQTSIPDRDLSYFNEGTRHFDDYVEAVGWAQDYARANREEMMDAVLGALGRHLPAFEVTGEAVNCHHNYVEREEHYGERVWLTRKGAIRAAAGELGIIPGSMGARSYIVRGRGNAESFHSCAHGAGRRMSRKAAQKRFSLSDLEVQTQGVVCRKDAGVLDEIPGAYKDIDTVMAAQADLVEVVHTLKQVMCIKG